jgi:hypothetical protein
MLPVLPALLVLPVLPVIPVMLPVMQPKLMMPMILTVIFLTEQMPLPMMPMIS